MDGNPATWIAGIEGWWMPEPGKWTKINSSELTMNARLMSKETFDRHFPDCLNSLPISAFQAGDSLSKTEL